MKQIYITPNNRSQKHLTEQLIEDQIMATGVATKQEVFTIKSFIETIFFNLQRMDFPKANKVYRDDEYLLQVALKAIQQSPIDTLLNRYDFASQVADTFKRCNENEVVIEAVVPETLDHYKFKEWFAAIKSEQRRNDVVYKADCLVIITSAVAEGILPPFNIKLTGFDEVPPYFKSFLDMNRQVGGIVDQENEPTNKNKNVFGLECQTQAEELNIACKAAYNIIKTNPSDKVAIVHPRLHEDSVRLKIEAALWDTFEPQYLIPGSGSYSAPFNITYGKPLSEVKIIADLLVALGLTNGLNKQTDILILLRSPYFADWTGKGKAEVDKLADRVEYIGKLDFKLTSIQRMIECPNDVSTKLNDFINVKKMQGTGARVDNHIDFTIRLIEALSWAQTRILNFEEKAALKSFMDSLEQMAQLDLACDYTDYQGFLYILRVHLNAKVFNAASKQSRLQVMGFLEAAGQAEVEGEGGQYFDHVIMMEMDNSQYPAAAQPNTLLPIQTQVKYQLPYCNAQNMLEFCSRVVKRIQAPAKTVINLMSLDVNGRARRKSCFFKGEALPQHLLKAPLVDYVKAEMGRIPVVEIYDQPKPYLNTTIMGGTSTIQKALDCPFKGFIASQLNPKTKTINNQGLSALDVGNLIHEAMQVLWTELGDQKTLLSLGDDELNQKIMTAIETAFFFFDRAHFLDQKLIRGEKKRLAKAILAHTELDKKRPGFVVKGLEINEKLKIKDKTIRVRIDRIDELDNNQNVVIDYKKSDKDLGSFGGQSKVQAPMYALQGGIDGISYSVVDEHQPKYKGVAQNPLFEGIATPIELRSGHPTNNYDELIETWKNMIERLVEQISLGRLELSPKSFSTCNHCEYSKLCRIKQKN